MLFHALLLVITAIHECPFGFFIGAVVSATIAKWLTKSRKGFAFSFLAMMTWRCIFCVTECPNMRPLITPPLLMGVKQQAELAWHGWAPKITFEIARVATPMFFFPSLRRSIIGKSVTDMNCFSKMQDKFVSLTVKNRENLPKDFKFFGTPNNKLNLKTILRHNPLYGMHLTSTRTVDGALAFEIKSYVPVSDPSPRTLYYKLVQSGNESFQDRVLVNAKFDENMDITSIVGYSRSGEVLSINDDDLCGFLLNSIRFASQLVHGAMHLHNSILVSAMYVGAEQDKQIEQWADQYTPQILIKNWQVETVLLSKSGLLTVNSNLQADAVRILGEVVRDWGSYSTAEQFNEQFIFGTLVNGAVSRADLEQAGLFTQYLKHCSLIAGYSSDLYDAFKLWKEDGVASVDREMHKYLVRSDPTLDWGIKNVRQWLESMSVMGIAHGFIPSITRLEMTPGVLGKDFLHGLKKQTFTVQDYNVILLLVGTLTGTQPGYAVFSSTRSKTLTNPVKDVIKHYEIKSNEFKASYYEEIRNLPNYADIGFILNDGIVDTVDSRQLTLTTYI